MDQELTNIINSLPFTQKQRELALNNIESISPERRAEIIRLFDSVINSLPAAIKTLEK